MPEAEPLETRTWVTHFGDGGDGGDGGGGGGGGVGGECFGEGGGGGVDGAVAATHHAAGGFYPGPEAFEAAGGGGQVYRPAWAPGGVAAGATQVPCHQRPAPAGGCPPADVNRGTRMGWGGGGGAGWAGGYCSGGGDWRDGGAAVPRAAGMAWGPPIQANGPRAGLLGRGERGGGGGEWEVVWSGRGGVDGVGGGVSVGGVGGGCGQRDGVGAQACWRWGWMGLAGTAR